MKKENNNRISSFVVILFVIVFYSSCSKKNSTTPVVAMTPSVTTSAISAITATTATSGGNVTSDGGASVTVHGVCWATSANPTTSNSKTTNGTGTGTFSSSLTGLTSATIYYVRAYATNSAGTAYGNQVSFTSSSIPGGLPALTTSAVINITPTTASSGGNITSDSGAAITARGVCWATSSNPTISNSKTTDGSSTGTFTSNVTGLTAATMYYVRAYATNSAGTAYGNQVSFTSSAATTPSLTTSAVSNITTTTASCGGNITSDSGATVTARGVCWATSSNPTISNSKTTDGAGVGTFTSSLTGLTASTIYYIRAYATNSVGTAYGNQVSFTSATAGSGGGDSVTIGNQVWMLKNLDVTTYRNGDPIPEVTDPSEWAALTTGAWCYNNNDTANNAVYGKLYNWYAVNDPRVLAPLGWHIPTDAELTTLTTFLGGASVAGGKMKEAGTVHWASPNTGATNESGFTALPSGYRSYDGSFANLGRFGYLWSSTEFSKDRALGRLLYYNSSIILKFDEFKLAGFCLRCLRD